VCGTKNFASVRLYSAPQLHRTIVAILGICAYGTPKQVETRRHNQTDPLPALGAKPHEAPRFAVPFPGMGNQKRFKDEMARIIPKLPRLTA